VETEDFVTDEVVAWGDVGGEGYGVDAAFHEIGLEPCSIRLATSLANLEPLGLCRIKPVTSLITT